MTARAVIDPDALSHNLRVVRGKAPGCKVFSVVKANGYGHGLVTAARSLSESDAFAVAQLGEGIAIRDAGLAHPTLLLEGVFDAAELQQALRHHLELVVHTEEQVDLLAHVPTGHRVGVWLKLNTGMNRLGIDPARAGRALERLEAMAGVSKPVRLMTHLAAADDPDGSSATRQLEAFARFRGGQARDISIANSAAILARPDSVAAPLEGRDHPVNWVRPGIMLYGASPLPGQTGWDLGLKPAMHFQARIISIQDVSRGQTVGYGDAWAAPRDCRIGVADAGYCDGYPWQARDSEAHVLVRGRRAPIVGRISMDMLSMDLSEVPDAALGDTVTLWGDAGLGVEQVAGWAQTIPYELLTRVGPRVLRPRRSGAPRRSERPA